MALHAVNAADTYRLQDTPEGEKLAYAIPSLRGLKNLPEARCCLLSRL